MVQMLIMVKKEMRIRTTAFLGKYPSLLTIVWASLIGLPFFMLLEKGKLKGLAPPLF